MSTGSSYKVKRFIAQIPREFYLFQANIYLLYNTDTGDAVIIDPGAKNEELEGFISANGLKVQAIVNTHGHYDHVSANGIYRALYECNVYGNPKDEYLYKKVPDENRPDKLITEDCELTFGGLHIKVITTPGHSAGSLCFIAGGMLFSGDTLFRESIGRTWDTEEGSSDENMNRLVTNIKERLLVLPLDTPVYPGHENTTTIEHEKGYNPFLQ